VFLTARVVQNHDVSDESEYQSSGGSEEVMEKGEEMELV